MKLITQDQLNALNQIQEGPHVSIYMSTYKSFPDHQQNHILFKNLVKKVEESLHGQYDDDKVEEVLKPFNTLISDTVFWNNTMEGLAVLSVPGQFFLFGLPFSVEERAIVAESFHTKPLRTYLQTTDRFQVLGLSLSEMKLFEGNRHGLWPVDLPGDMPATIEKALGSELTDEHLTVASYGGVGSGNSQMVHGHGGRKDELDKDAERYFRAVSKAVYDNYSKPSGLPLVLAALPEHHNLYHKVSSNHLLMQEGVKVHPDDVSAEELAQKAWQIIEPEYNKKINGYIEQFNQAKSKGTGSDKLEEIAAAAATAKVQILLAEEGKMLPGRITNTQTGDIEHAPLDDANADDLIDDIAEMVDQKGGEVFILPSEKMPVDTGLAAIYRY